MRVYPCMRVNRTNKPTTARLFRVSYLHPPRALSTGPRTAARWPVAVHVATALWLVLPTILVVEMVSKAVRETHAELTKNINRLVGSRMTPASVAKIEVLLDLVEHFAIDNPTINFHLHMSGYDLSGKVFWVPIFEDQVVLDSPAKRVLNMIYRYIESADSMLAESTTLLEKTKLACRGKESVPQHVGLAGAASYGFPSDGFQQTAHDGGSLHCGSSTLCTPLVDVVG